MNNPVHSRFSASDRMATVSAGPPSPYDSEMTSTARPSAVAVSAAGGEMGNGVDLACAQGGEHTCVRSPHGDDRDVLFGIEAAVQLIASGVQEILQQVVTLHAWAEELTLHLRKRLEEVGPRVVQLAHQKLPILAALMALQAIVGRVLEVLVVLDCDALPGLLDAR